MGGVPGGVPGGQMGGVLGGIIDSTSTSPKIATPQRVRVSAGVAEANVLRRVEPAYSPLAKQARIQGDVVLRVVINQQGEVENLVVLSGHPLLVQAAIDAVKQWRYRPYLLDGKPVEVETTVTIHVPAG